MLGDVRVDDLEVHQIVAQPLGIDAFASYGVCGIRPDAPPTWRAGGSRVSGVSEGEHVDDEIAGLWRLGDLEFDAPVYVGSVRYVHQGFRVAELERHVGETQTWIATRGSGFIVVAPPTPTADDLQIADVRAFLVEPGDLVALHRGAWMCHFFPIGPDADYLVVTSRREPEQDRDLVSFARTRRAVLEIVLAESPGASAR